ncbi:MAG: hypothetical protein E7481_04925 [Ruminococcaceae bacterium]|nr:hypothetical protein [Oscillospiraceae bacterium]
MPVVNVNLLLDDATYSGVKSGMLELCGMVKDVDSKKVRKHLPTVFDAAKDGASKAIDIIREHQKGFLIIGVLVIIGGALAGTITYFTQKDKLKAQKRLSDSLDHYLNSAQSGTITLEIIDTLLSDLSVVSEFYNDKDIPIKLSPKQLSSLLSSVYDYTLRLASANKVSVDNISSPKILSKNKIIDLKQYLIAQKEILKTVA